jgi:lambda repressor-like predicted transcriptional regulator
VSEVVLINVRYFLAEKGMSMDELARGSGHTPEFLERALNDPGMLRLANMEAIARKLGVHVRDLLQERDS